MRNMAQSMFRIVLAPTCIASLLIIPKEVS